MRRVSEASIHAGGESCLPLLFEEETACELADVLHLLQKRGYTPLSLLDWFRIRRGVQKQEGNTFCVLFRQVSVERLRVLASLLLDQRVPAQLFCDTYLPEWRAAPLLQTGLFSIYPETTLPDLQTLRLHPDWKDDFLAAFCPNPAEADWKRLRDSGVRMVFSGAEVPFACPSCAGIELLPVRRVSAGMKEEALLAPLGFPRGDDWTLPLDLNPPLSAPEQALPLSVLGSRPERLKRFLLFADWRAAFQRETGQYTVFPAQPCVRSSPFLPDGDSIGKVSKQLRAGRYLFLHTHLPGDPPSLFRKLVLFGRDGGDGTFRMAVSLVAGTLEVAELLPETLEQCLNRPDTHASLLSPDAPVPSLGLHTLCRRISGRLQEVPSDPTCYQNWNAALQFCNGFANRAAVGSGPISAVSVRAFFEERFLWLSCLEHFVHQADLYAEPFAAYRSLLERGSSSLFLQLRGSEYLTPALPLLSLGDWMRSLLVQEERCLRCFLEEAERARRDAAFLDQ